MLSHFAGLPLLPPSFQTAPDFCHSRRGHSQRGGVEVLESRIAPAAVVSILRAAGAAPETAAASVDYTVTFDESVTGVDATDFVVFTGGDAHANPLVSVTGSGASYTVTIGELHGAGEVRLEL